MLRQVRGYTMQRGFRVILACLPLLFSLSLVPAFLCAEEMNPESPLSLRDCVAVSLSSSPDVIAAHARVEQARAAVRQAQAGFYPRLSISETFTRSNFAPLVFSNQLAQGNLSGSFPVPFPPDFDPFGGFNDPGPLSNWNTRLLLEAPLFQGGRTYYGNRAAGANLSATELATRTIQSNLAFAVSRAYYEILKTENSIDIAVESTRQIRSHLTIAEARFENEVALRSDVLRVKVRLAEAKEALEIARHNLERAKSQLNLAMGQSVNQPLELVRDEMQLEIRSESGQTLDDLISLARQNRTEIEGIDRNIASLENLVAGARAGYYPRINAFAHYDVDTEDFSDSNDSWTIGIGASFQIFDGHLTRSAVSAARARLSEAEARKQQLVLRIEMEVKDAFLKQSEAARRFEVLEQSVGEAEETLRIVSERYAEGAALITELLDAEVALTNTRLSLLSARYDNLIAAAALDRGVGRIVEEGQLR